jgi:hypothetical protein
MANKYRVDFVHDFIVPVEYACGGQMCKAIAIQVMSPMNSQLAELSVLEQEHNKALLKVGQNIIAGKQGGATPPVAAAQPQSDNTPNEVVETYIQLLSANGFDMAKGYETIQSLLLADKNPAMIDGKEKITQLLFDSMTPTDTRLILGKYLLNFLTSSRKA